MMIGWAGVAVEVPKYQDISWQLGSVDTVEK